VARDPDDSPLRDASTQGLKTLLAEFTALSDGRDVASRRRQALADFSMMIGALVLSRATRGDALSEELLDTARKTLHAQARS
jgi:TetR/AcrR family transcriptional regulator, transcriptional repressor for nem operon